MLRFKTHYCNRLHKNQTIIQSGYSYSEGSKCLHQNSYTPAPYNLYPFLYFFFRSLLASLSLNFSLTGSHLSGRLSQ